MSSRSEIVVTGDRPTGRLHLGHYAGSLRTRLELQQQDHTQIVLIADLQALTDNVGRVQHVRSNVMEVALDYLAVGLDPTRSTIALQSGLPELSELTILYLNLVTIARLERNPTVRHEIHSRSFDRDVPAGFFCYPVSQAADITAFRGTLVPVGEDQIPMIEQANEIVRRINRMTNHDLLPEVKALLSSTPRLPGTDGQKAGKSLGNAIELAAPPDVIAAKVRSMFTDPGHVRAADPGRVEGNVVFAHLDAFDPEPQEVERLKERYRAGGLGDTAIKERLNDVLQAFIAPIRERRAELAADPDVVLRAIREGTLRARAIASQVTSEIKDAFALDAVPE